MVEIIPPGYIRIVDARERLHDAAFPDAVYSYGKPDMTVQDQAGSLTGSNIHLKDERYGQIDNMIVAALRDGRLTAWVSDNGELIGSRPASEWEDEPGRPGETAMMLYHGKMYRGERPIPQLLNEAEFATFLIVAAKVLATDAPAKKARKEAPDKHLIRRNKIQATLAAAERIARTRGITPKSGKRARELAQAIYDDAISRGMKAGDFFGFEATRRIITGTYDAQIKLKISGYFLK
jgi:hypothetical protein